MRTFRGLFARPQEILGRVSATLNVNYPRAQAEVFLKGQGEGGMRARAGTLEDMLRVFEDHCGRWPSVRLVFSPEHPYGMVASVTCACEATASPCSIACRNDHERPSAMLCITQVSGNDVLVGANARGCVAEDREG